MKKLFPYIAAVTLAFATGCVKETETDSAVGQALRGTHPLKALTVQTTTQGSASGGYFILVGSLEAQAIQTAKLRFAWTDNQGLVSISELPVTKLKFQFNPSNSTPTIKFRWMPGSYAQDTQSLMDREVIYALISCREEDFPSHAGANLKQLFPEPAKTAEAP